MGRYRPELHPICAVIHSRTYLIFFPISTATSSKSSTSSKATAISAHFTAATGIVRKTDFNRRHAHATPSFFCRLDDDVVYWNISRLSG